MREYKDRLFLSLTNKSIIISKISWGKCGASIWEWGTESMAVRKTISDVVAHCSVFISIGMDKLDDPNCKSYRTLNADVSVLR